MKRVVISSFITLIILALLAVSYFYFQRYSIVTTNPVTAIPANAVFFIEAKGGKQLMKKLINEDLERQGAQQIQEVTDKYVAEVDRISEEKQKEIMEF